MDTGVRVVIGADYGGFGLSEKAQRRYLELYKASGRPWCQRGTASGHADYRHECLCTWTNPRDGDEEFDASSIERTDPLLLQVLDEFGSRANDRRSHLVIVTIDPLFANAWRIQTFKYEAEGLEMDLAQFIKNTYDDHLEGKCTAQDALDKIANAQKLLAGNKWILDKKKL